MGVVVVWCGGFEFKFICHKTDKIHYSFTVRTIKDENACFSSKINAGAH